MSMLQSLLAFFLMLVSAVAGGSALQGLGAPPPSPLSPPSFQPQSGPGAPLGPSGPGAQPPGGPLGSPQDPFASAAGLGPGSPGPLADGVGLDPSAETQGDAPGAPGTSQGCGGDVALVGDSITAAAGYRQHLQAACSGARFSVYAAVGRSTSQMLAGFQQVLAGGHDTVVLLGGVNNIADDEGVRRDLGEMYSRSRGAGWKVVAVTVLPYKGYSSWSAERGAKVRAVNSWIHQQASAGAIDAVADGFAALGDPSDPDALRPGESADRLHPNDAGYQRLAPVVAAALGQARGPAS